jgi:putative ABC transport system substrate-binding protein
MGWLKLATWMIVALIVIARAAEAQQPGRVYKIGNLSIGRPGFVIPPPEQWIGPQGAYRDTLRDAGFVLGKNLVFEVRHGNGDATRLGAEAEALVASGVDVIVTSGTPSTLAAIQATTRIPIVFVGVSDPVEKRIVSNLARPGSNVTGMAVMIAYAKQWELLHEVAPTVRRAPHLFTLKGIATGDRATAMNEWFVRSMKAFAAVVGIETFPLGVNSLSEVEAKFAELASGGAAGVFVLNESLMTTDEWRPFILKMALNHRLPTSCAENREWAESGCLVTYAEDWYAIGRGGAAQVVKVLRGTWPGDIPVEQPTSYKLIINDKTAKALDLTVPPALLAAAAEVIE